MKISSKQYALALFESLQSTQGNDQDLVLDNFAAVLSQNNDLKLFEEIAEEYHKLELKQKGVKLVEATTAHPLSQESEREIISQLNRLVGGKVELKKKIDENLIGGVVIRMEDELIDASVKGSLEQLKKNLAE